MKKLRTETEILQNILSVCKKGVNQGKLIDETKISPQMFTKYEQKLLNSKRITKEKLEGTRQIKYAITTKGLKTLEALKKLHRLKVNILRSMR